ncbi:ATP-grasp domain-containing protein [Desulfovibrio sp. UCD-KL4C]|uniref:ATP-grasp domain-containing protein n=1 Tax=Desulfovibrio sp. UCD-KL4C TaxID=2578120 RepID=UPI0025C58B5B|nr:ATP-grasp domain-containing protein [Desulfovibrio sp. UCD-KL4C]
MNIMITAVGDANVGAQIYSALQNLPDYEISITNIVPLTTGNPDNFILAPLASSKIYINFILETCIDRKIEMLIPGSEAELAVISKHRRLFKEKGITLLMNTEQVLDTCLDKEKTVEFLKKNNFNYPRTVKIHLEKRVELILDSIEKEIMPPYVLKPNVGAGGSKDIYIIQSREEALHILNYIKLTSHGQFIAQEYVGSYNEEYTIGVMSNQQAKAYSAFVLKRNLTSTLSVRNIVKNQCFKRIKDDNLIISTGISQGHVGDYPKLKKFAFNVANAIGSIGPLNIQCRIHNEDIYIFEINPRFSGTTSIRALCGHNDPEIMISELTSKDFTSKQIPYTHGLAIRSLKNQFIPEKGNRNE